jgi:hypothetical protein
MGVRLALPRGYVSERKGSVELDLRRLFALNVLLQLVDGFITHQALQIGFFEGNPIVRESMSALGPGWALLLFKAKACAFLLLLRRSVPPELGKQALWWVAVGYALLAIVPWLGLFLAFPWSDFQSS